MKNIYIVILILVFMLPFSSLYSQQGVIQGRVYNEKNNDPVMFASVAIFGTSIGSTTDLDGNFLFTGLEPGYVELHVSSAAVTIQVQTGISFPIWRLLLPPYISQNR